MCAWKRPYDRITEERVRLEALAVAGLLEAAAAGRMEIVGSEILAAENSRNPDPVRREEVGARLSALSHIVPLDESVALRAREIEQLGLRPLDALHVASAEAGSCVFLVTTDDRMRLRLARNAGALRVRITDPLQITGLIEGSGP